MKKSPFCNFTLAGVSLNEYGLQIPSPFSSLNLSNNEKESMTQWTLRCVVGGDDSRKVNIAAFEALLYSAAQTASGYSNSSGIPVSFIYGWLKSDGTVEEYSSYQGFTLQFEVSTSGRYMIYTVKGWAELAVQSSMPALRIPEVRGIVQPSAIVEALAIGTKADKYYQLDIDHNDEPTLVQHGALTTSFNRYVRGTYTRQDNYTEFPGLLRLSKSYNVTRDAAGLNPKYKKLSQIQNNLTVSSVRKFMQKCLTDSTPQCSSFSFWIDEPSMTRPGIIHYKSDAGLLASYNSDVLEYGTANTNVLSLEGSYNGIAYNMTDMRFAQVGFVLDGVGHTILDNAQVTNSWSSSLASTFQTANIINDVNAIASQFTGNFTVKVPGTTKRYKIAQPVAVLVVAGNTISPITGIYNIVSVSQEVNAGFVTTLKLQRLTVSSANEVAAGRKIFVNGSSHYSSNSFIKTSNIKSPYHVDFGIMFPTFENLTLVS